MENQISQVCSWQATPLSERQFFRSVCECVGDERQSKHHLLFLGYVNFSRALTEIIAATDRSVFLRVLLL